MHKYFYDFHIHSCLSPCGDDDMTPNNIAGMAAIKGLSVIALSLIHISTAESTGANPSSASVKEMFFFFDFADVNMVGSACYFDEIGLVPE